MIKVAIISDIHANIIALKEVLKDIERRRVCQIYCLGDLVDFAPWGNEVIDLMRSCGIPCILGNHDERIAFDLPIKPLAHHGSIETENRLMAINHSKDHITSENKRWLATLPYHIELTYKLGAAYKKIWLVHASLDRNDEYVEQAEAPGKFLPTLYKKEINVLVTGHTHRSYVQHFQDVSLVNCGSVGRSREEDRKATYTILTLSETETIAEIVKLDYKIDQVAAAIYSSDIPDFYGDFLLNN